MGKQNYRLSLGNSSQDARFKLISRDRGRIKDAREILAAKQNRIKPVKTRSATEPLMIVTGIDNIRRVGNKLRVISRPPPPEKTVISDGRNTIVTLRNPTAVSMDNMKFGKETNGEAGRRGGRIDNHDREFKAIKVQFDNDLARASSPSPSHFRRDEEVMINSKRHGRSPSPRRSSHRHHHRRHSSSSRQRHHGYDSGSDEVAMDYDDPPYPETTDNPNGYKLIVSNLHSRVTQDDILELFSDIGPIKRAKFLDKGVAEVVYVKLEHAKKAMNKYDRSELDGRQMKIEMGDGHRHSSSSSSRESSSIKTPEKSGKTHRESNHHHVEEQPLNLLSNKFKSLVGNETPSIQLPQSARNSSRLSIDTGIVQQVLFNKSASVGGSQMPVTFTVKL